MKNYTILNNEAFEKINKNPTNKLQSEIVSSLKKCTTIIKKKIGIIIILFVIISIFWQCLLG